MRIKELFLMGRNDGVEARKIRIQAVVKRIVATLTANKNRGWIPLDTTVADIEFEEGLTEKRIMEYATIGEKRGLYVIDVKQNKIIKTES
jgi:hypothetical protein